MNPEERNFLDETISRIRSGRITRRTFLERAMAVGLSSAAAVSLLEACGGTSNSTGGNGQTVNLVWQSEQDSTNTYKQMTDNFNSSVGKQKGIHVTWNQGPSSTNDLLTKYDNMLRARSGSIDVMSIDVVYPAEFASNQWSAPITDSQWPASARANYLAGPIQSCTYQGQLVAAPFRTDIGVIYYRTDLISTPPNTWDELTSMAKSAMPKTKYGYVWQGAQYEGLVCDFVEVLHGYGGDVLDSSNKITVNSAEGVQALTQMVSWVGGISPQAVTTYMEDPSRLVWQNGDSAFMRNWPYAIALGNASGSNVAGKFDIHPMMYGGSNTTGHSCTGGWNLAINAFSSNTNASWEFINYLLGPDAQKLAAINASLTVTLKSVYTDADVLAKEPLFSKLQPILETALPRPVSPRYPDLSNAIQARLHGALLKQATPADALNALANDLKAFV